MTRTLASCITAALLAGCTMADEDGQTRRERGQAAATLDGQRYGDGAVKAGEPQSCIPIIQIRDSHVLGDQVIDFETAGGRVYRNVLPNSCPSLGFEERFAYQTSLSQLCSTDIITVLHSPGVTRGASCGLGQFQPIERAAR